MIAADDVHSLVSMALHEDVGSGDITAQLIDAEQMLSACVITREPAVICGKAWVDATFAAVDDSVKLHWQVVDGDQVSPGQVLFTVAGNARSLLTAERTALNFLQMLSATATVTQRYAQKIAHTQCRLLDTRKTIPGYRLAQKYAVRCGGGHNHRIGLFDAFLIKENHIAACGGVSAAVHAAKHLDIDKSVEIEVENLDEFDIAQQAGADIIMLDNFSLTDMITAVARKLPHVKLEASGNMDLARITEVAETGVDFISVGAITKHIEAIDLSMRYV